MSVEVARLLGFVFAFIFCVSAASAVTLSNAGGGSWAYYKEITVKENSGKTLTDYQVLVELNSANFDFSKAKSDGSDIRFSLNGEELNYWIEEWNLYAKKAKIWVKVPHIPANGEVKIKMYYGNPSASAVSNGDTVFEFFDDFESGVIDTTNKWEPGGTATIVDNPYPIGEDKVLDVSYDHYLYSKNTFPPPFAYRCSGASSFGFSPNIGVVTYQHYDSTSGATQLFWRAHPTVARPHENAWESAIKYEAHPADWSTAYSPIPPYQYKTWFVGETVVKNRSYHAHYVNGILVKEWTGTMIGNINPGIRVIGGHNQAEQYIDWVLIRKYTEPEPTLAFSAEYPVVRTALTLRKSVSPYSIKQGQKANVIITVENAGTTTLYDIEVVDTPPAEFEFVSGDTSAKYTALKPGESRTFSYVIKSVSAGKFDLGKAKATYADEEGNYHTVESNAPMIEVLAPLIAPEIPREEKKIPGFEIASALAAIFAVARMRGRRRK